MLTFSAPAWLKLQYLCHLGDTEVGAFGISSGANPLYLDDVALVRQRCSCVSVEFDDEAVAAYFDEQIDAGRRPDAFARIWLHTHPGGSPEPSITDEETLERVFGRCDWSVMFILARGGSTYARLNVATGSAPDRERVGLTSMLDVSVEYATLVDADLPFDIWASEYRDLVHEESLLRLSSMQREGLDDINLDDFGLGVDLELDEWASDCPSADQSRVDSWEEVIDEE